MHTLRQIFTLMAVSGCSRPSSWTSPSKKFLYNVYATCLLLIVYTVTISQILDLLLIVDNKDDFSDNFYMAMVMIITCFKMCSLLMTREYIEVLIDTLQGEPFLPTNAEELEIRTRFDKAAESSMRIYMILIEITIIWILLMSLITDFDNRKLTFRAWLPFDYSSALRFSFAYAHQALGTIICTLSNISCDSLFAGLMIHIICQFEILGHRLQNIQADEIDLAKQCARHHNQIYKFAGMVNKEFKGIVFIQFLMSTSTVCLDLYRLTNKNEFSKTLGIMMYASCTLMQICYYCWYANEVKLKSCEVPDMVFECDWTPLNNNTKKILLMIMRRAMIPIQFTSLYVLSVNLDSFKALLKTSYSTYNLLHQTQ